MGPDLQASRHISQSFNQSPVINAKSLNSTGIMSEENQSSNKVANTFGATAMGSSGTSAPTEGKQTKQLSLLEEPAPAPVAASPEVRLQNRNSLLRFDEDDGYPEGLPLISAEWPDGRTDREVEIDLSEVAKRTLPHVRFGTAVNIPQEMTDSTAQSFSAPKQPTRVYESDFVDSVTPKFLLSNQSSAITSPSGALDSIDFEEGVRLLTGETPKSAPNCEKPTEKTEKTEKLFQELEMSSNPAEIEEKKLVESFGEVELDLKSQGSILNFPPRDKAKTKAAESTAAFDTLTRALKNLANKQAPVPTKNSAKSQAAQQAKKKTSPQPKQLAAAAQAARAIRNYPVNIRALGIALVGPAITTLAIYLVSISGSPLLLAGGKSSAMAAPPSGLELDALKSELKVLQDGTQFLEVTGFLKNNTPVTYSDVQLIARGFDRKNNKLSEVITATNNGLQHVNNSETLKAYMLVRLQSERGVVQHLKPADRVDIRLAIPVKAESPAYFDAEVYGVRRAS
jgi:hypothetical protein